MRELSLTPPVHSKSRKRTTLTVALATGLVLLSGGGVVFAMKQTEQTLQQQLKQTREALESTGVVRIEEKPARRTLLGATQETVITVDLDDQPMVITLVNTITNGPFPKLSSFGAAVVDTDVRFEPKVQAQLDKAFGNQKPFIRTLVQFGGNTRTTFVVPSGSISEQDATFSWKAISGTLRGEGPRVVSDVLVPSLVVRDAAMTMELQGTRVTSDQVSGTDGLADGTGTWSTEKMTFTGKGGDVAMQKLVVSSDATTESGNYNTSVKYDLQKLEVAGKTLNDLKLHLSSRQVDRASLAALVKVTGSMSAAEDPGAALANVSEPLGALLAKNPEFSLDRLSLRNGGGEITLDGKAALTGNVNVAALMSNPALLMQHVAVTANANAAEAAVLEFAGLLGTEQPGVMVEELVQGGMLKREGKNVKSQLRLTGDGVTVNGQPLGF